MINDWLLLKQNPNDEEQLDIVMGLQIKPSTLSEPLFPRHSMVDPNSEKTFFYFVHSGKTFVVKKKTLKNQTQTSFFNQFYFIHHIYLV